MNLKKTWRSEVLVQSGSGDQKIEFKENMEIRNLAKVVKPPSSDEAAPARFVSILENLAKNCNSILNEKLTFKHNNCKITIIKTKKITQLLLAVKKTRQTRKDRK